MSDPNRASPGIKSYVSQWTGYGAKQEKPGHEASKVPSKNLAEKKKTHSWISKFQRRARQVIKLRRITGSFLPTQRSSITDETLEPAFPPQRSLFPFPRVTSPVSFLPLPGPEIPSSKLSPPVEEPLSTPPPLDLPSLQPSPTGPAALDEGEAPVTNGWRPINATTELNDLCFEFLQVDDRPTVIMEVKPKPEATKSGDVMVDILFTNPAFEHLKPQLKLDFKSPEELGGMLKRSPSPVEWTVENDDWQLRCVGVGRDTNGGWAKVLTVDPVMESLHGDLEGEDAGIRTDNEEEEYLGSRGSPDLQRRAVPLEYHLENYGGGGVGDVRRMSITEESPQGSSGSDVTALGLRLLTTDGTSSSTKTITPNYSRAPTARGSLASSSNSTSRRSSRSLPCSRRGSSPLGIPESPSARSESNERRPGDKPNMDWTRGAILQKNTQNLEGMDDHLNFLMKAPW
ncbi:hypothetical protein DFP73DRAFT_621016 [Morchella snyderi]|nr:hypothetical protein DFP73DRAFT_621016 [Morchella snyderi]